MQVLVNYVYFIEKPFLRTQCVKIIVFFFLVVIITHLDFNGLRNNKAKRT